MVGLGLLKVVLRKSITVFAEQRNSDRADAKRRRASSGIQRELIAFLGTEEDQSQDPILAEVMEWIATSRRMNACNTVLRPRVRLEYARTYQRIRWAIVRHGSNSSNAPGLKSFSLLR